MNKPVALIIEDDETLADLLAIIVELAGYQAETVLDGLRASTRLGNPDLPHPVLVVLDLHLPGLSGDEILRQIRENPLLVKTAIVIVTADYKAPAVYHPGATGIQPDELLIKPVDIQKLQAEFEKYREGRETIKD